MWAKALCWSCTLTYNSLHLQILTWMESCIIGTHTTCSYFLLRFGVALLEKKELIWSFMITVVVKEFYHIFSVYLYNVAQYKRNPIWHPRTGESKITDNLGTDWLWTTVYTNKKIFNYCAYSFVSIDANISYKYFLIRLDTVVFEAETRLEWSLVPWQVND